MDVTFICGTAADVAGEQGGRTHSYVCHDSFINATHMCDMTHMICGTEVEGGGEQIDRIRSYVSKDSFINVTCMCGVGVAACCVVVQYVAVCCATRLDSFRCV